MSALSPRDVLLDKVLTYFAANGVGDTSLRTLAAGIGTSHRMLIYHFDSRDGLLAAVVDVMCRQQLEGVGVYLQADEKADPREVAWAAWSKMADDVPVFAPLFFELSAYAMSGHQWTAQLQDLIKGATRALAAYFVSLGHSPERAQLLANTAMAVSRGAAFDLAITQDRQAADDVIRGFLDWALVPEQV